MTEATIPTPAAAPTTAAPVPVSAWARVEAPTPAAPTPQYLSTSEIKAMTNHADLTAAMRDGRVGWMSKPEALERLATLLQEQVGVSVQTREVAPAENLGDWSLPPTDAEAERMTSMERDAFTRPPGLVSDYTIPGDHPSLSEGTRATNEAIRQALFAAQVPVPVANTVLGAANAIAQRIVDLDPEEAAKLADTRSELVRNHLKGQWGAAFEPRIAAVKSYLKSAGDKAHAAGQPMLREILTNSPELLDDPASITALWNAARLAGR